MAVALKTGCESTRGERRAGAWNSVSSQRHNPHKTKDSESPSPPRDFPDSAGEDWIFPREEWNPACPAASVTRGEAGFPPGGMRFPGTRAASRGKRVPSQVRRRPAMGKGSLPCGGSTLPVRMDSHPGCGDRRPWEGMGIPRDPGRRAWPVGWRAWNGENSIRGAIGGRRERHRRMRGVAGFPQKAVRLIGEPMTTGSDGGSHPRGGPVPARVKSG